VGHVARTGEKMDVYRTTVGKLKERDHLEDLDVGGDNTKLDREEV